MMHFKHIMFILNGKMSRQTTLRMFPRRKFVGVMKILEKIRNLRSGLRDQSVSAPEVGDRLTPIHPKLQGRNESLGDCVWRAVALIVFITSVSDVEKMLELLEKDHECFLWTSFFPTKGNARKGIRQS